MNGWVNPETWNVMLWMANDESLYDLARECDSYDEFVDDVRSVYGNEPLGYETPDGVAWNDSSIDRRRVNEFWVDNFKQEV